MIMTKIPLRVSFCGGGSDIPFFINEFGYGKVVATTIQRYIYTYINYNQYHQSYFIKYTSSENTTEVDKIQHPVIRFLLKKYTIPYCELGSIADIPGKSGLGSSSAFTAAMLAGIYTLKNIEWTKESIARDVLHIEMNELKEKIGYQDVYSCVFGGLNQYTFYPDGRVEQERITLDPIKIQKMEEEMVLVKTVFKENRSASKILHKTQTAHNLSAQKNILDLVEGFYTALSQGDTIKMGEILNKNWEYKKSLNSDVSNLEINTIYDQLMQYGSYGGKLLGAGSTGFLLMIFPKDKLQALAEHFPQLILEPFKFDFTGISVC